MRISIEHLPLWLPWNGSYGETLTYIYVYTHTLIHSVEGQSESTLDECYLSIIQHHFICIRYHRSHFVAILNVY